MGVGEIDRGAEMMLGEVPTYYVANNNYHVRIARERGDRKDFQPHHYTVYLKGTLGKKNYSGTLSKGTASKGQGGEAVPGQSYILFIPNKTLNSILKKSKSI